MEFYHIVIIAILLCLIINNTTHREGFQSSEEVKRKSAILYKNKDIFKPGVSYTQIKQEISWIDPVVYDKVYKLSLKENLTNSNIEKTFYTL